jgi:uncharacterized RDD family membrane protein YckC
MSEPLTSCVRHRGAPGRPCARCGDYACADCLQPFDGSELCLSCFESVAMLAEPSARLGAYLANQALATVPACLLLGLAIVAVPRHGLLIGAALALVWGVVFVALNIVLLRRHAQTLGKRWFGIRVLRADGRRPGLAQLLLLREVVPLGIGLIPWLGVLFGLVDSALVFSTPRRMLHDMIAGTIVVQVPKARWL